MCVWERERQVCSSTQTVCERTGHVSFCSCKMVYRIVLESVSFIVSLISCIPLCIWHYYKDKVVIWWEKVPLLHTQISPSYCHLIQISNSLPPSFFPPHTTICFYLFWPFSFSMLYGFLLTHSQTAVLCCFTSSSYEGPSCNTNNHCHHPPPPQELSCLYFFIFFLRIVCLL